MDHSPGPWELNWSNVGGCSVVPKDGHGTIAKVLVRYSKTDNLAEINANARLIAAAPELLEACRNLTKEINLGKLNIRKDFSLMNAHAAALKAIFKTEDK